MGVTIAYRGRLGDLSRIEDFEDRLVDLALEFGGRVRIWRTWADDNPGRIVRGVILDIGPGHDSASLLISPEGWLIRLTDIEDAEDGRLDERPWCFVKTQFGPVEGHVALVEMFATLKPEFLPDLEVCDEGGYWETRDLGDLVRKRTLIQGAIDGLAEGLQRYGLSHEAAEDPDILLRHIERVAALVHRNMGLASEHPPVATEDDDEEGGAADPGATEELRDKLSKDEGDDRLEIGLKERHALLQKARDLLAQVDTIVRGEDPRVAAALATLHEGARDALGGLAQALSHRDRDRDALDHGLRDVQLKRALRGAAFAQGALFPLRSSIGKEQFDELIRLFQQMETDIFSELGKVRAERGGDDS